MINKIQIYLGISILLLITTLSPKLNLLNSASAQVQSQCASPIPSTPSRANGLVTTPSIAPASKFYTSQGTCIVSPQAAFVPYKIPTYDDLKSVYYTQAKSTNTVTKHDPIGSGTTEVSQSSIDLSGTKNHLYFVNGNLTKNGAFPQDANLKTGVVFVEGNFTIMDSIGYAGGLVFIVKGDINIDPVVPLINAVLISQGFIYTAGTGCAPSSVTSSALTVNGSLILLDSTRPIKFCRKLSNNATAAEIINHQPKYLILLRNLMSQTLQKWSEVTK